MKKSVFLLLILLFSILFLSFSSENAYCESKSKEEIEKNLKDEISRYVETLDLSEFEDFVRDLDSPSDVGSLSLSDWIKKITDGETPLSFSSLLSFLWERFAGVLSGTFAALLTVMILSVASSILSGLTSGFLKKQTIEIVHYVIYALVVTVVMVKIASVVSESAEAIGRLTSLTEKVFPPLVTLMSALGGAVSSSLYKPQLAFFCALIGKIIGSVILPLFTASISFCLIGHLSETVKMDKIQSAIRYASSFIISTVFGLFITYLTVAGISGGMVDGVSIKAAKFVVSSYVPILGGYLSQGFDLISAGCVLIKNAIGVVGIVYVLLIVLKPILDIVVLTFALKIVASFVQPIGDKRISDFLYSVSNSTKILITALVGTGFVLIVSLLLVVVTCNVGVI